MLCYTALYSTILCYIMLCCIICIILCYVLRCYTILHYAILWNAISIFNCHIVFSACHCYCNGQVGVGGGGGEYVPQKGFGWSNGVALYLLQYTSPGGTSAVDDDEDELTLMVKILVLGVICVSLGVLLALGYYMYRYFRKGVKRDNSDRLDRDYDNNIHINILQRNDVKSSLI